MKRHKLTLLEKRIIRGAAEIAYYGWAWADCTDCRTSPDDAYRLGGIDTVAHQVACIIVQRLGLAKGGCDTAETRDALGLDATGLTEAKIRRRLECYVIALKKNES